MPRNLFKPRSVLVFSVVFIALQKLSFFCSIYRFWALGFCDSKLSGDEMSMCVLTEFVICKSCFYGVRLVRSVLGLSGFMGDLFSSDIVLNQYGLFGFWKVQWFCYFFRCFLDQILILYRNQNFFLIWP